MEYKELTEKINKSLAELVTCLKIHEAYLQAFASAGLIEEKEATKDQKYMVEGIADIIKKETLKNGKRK